MLTRSRATPLRRLPGLRFEVQTEPLEDVLPRMDVAALVGFASSGPLHTPVVIEDVAQFSGIFGPDAPLAWDGARGEMAYANLGPAVRAFFRNGGQRCWVVRVAGNGASANRFPVPGLACLAAGDQPISQARATARSEGSWSDDLQVSTALLSDPVALIPVSLSNLTFDLPASHAGGTGQVEAGDLLRLTFADTGDLLFTQVQSVAIPANPGGPFQPIQKTAQRVTGSSPAWFRSISAADDGLALTAAWNLAGETPAPLPVTALPLRVEADNLVMVELGLSLADAPLPGSLLRVDAGPQRAYLTVQTVHSSASADTVEVGGEGLWWSSAPPDPLPASPPLAEVLTFELWVRQGVQAPLRLSDLGFGPGHPRYWGDLPLDVDLYDLNPLAPKAAVPNLWAEAASLFTSTGVSSQGASPRFPLAGTTGPSFSIPLGMGVLPEAYLGPLEQPGTSLERDGLAAFSAALFLDPGLIGASTLDLINEADYLRYQSPQPRRLQGIHAVLGIEEVTLLAVPDALQRGWALSAPPASLGGLEFPPLPHPEWWRFQACPQSTIPLASQPPRDHFLACDLLVLPAPELSAAEPGSSGNFVLTWTDPQVSPPAEITGKYFILEEATTPDFSGAEELYRGLQTTLSIYSRSPGEYYYRVRMVAGEVSSDWSNGVGVRVALPDRWVVKAEADYTVEPLLAVQRGLLRMCAARGDLFAVLSLPGHYREDQAIEHVSRLKSFLDDPVPVGSGFILPLSGAEVPALSYGAVYHPWLAGGSEALAGAANTAALQPLPGAAQAILQTPPDGAALGVLAQRALARGAWVAAANEPMQGVVALAPAISRERWLDLQDAGINLVRQEPDGFMTLNSATLSDDPDLDEINVRRLLILLRRLALREGAGYVFEPNDAVFQRMVQRSFEAWLALMFNRGAFAGRTQPESFQVNVISTPQDVDAGRFIVELRVAPSLPLKFLTIRLVQTGERGLIQEGRS